MLRRDSRYKINDRYMECKILDNQRTLCVGIVPGVLLKDEFDRLANNSQIAVSMPITLPQILAN